LDKAQDIIEFHTEVTLGKLTPEDVKVTIFFGKEDSRGKIINFNSMDMKFNDSHDGKFFYSASINLESCGVINYSIRIIPDHPLMVRKINSDLVTWS